MRVTQLAAAVAAAAAAVLTTATPASAHLVDVTTGTNGTCPSGYGELAQADQTTVCIHVLVPDATVVTTGAPCPFGYTEYSVLNFYRVCVDLNH